MRMRTIIRAARARIIGAMFWTTVHQIRVLCLPVSLEPLRDFGAIGFSPPLGATLHDFFRALLVGERRRGPLISLAIAAQRQVDYPQATAVHDVVAGSG